MTYSVCFFFIVLHLYSVFFFSLKHIYIYVHSFSVLYLQNISFLLHFAYNCFNSNFLWFFLFSDNICWIGLYALNVFATTRVAICLRHNNFFKKLHCFVPSLRCFHEFFLVLSLLALYVTINCEEMDISWPHLPVQNVSMVVPVSYFFLFLL